jgi:hypothetical protein
MSLCWVLARFVQGGWEVSVFSVWSDNFKLFSFLGSFVLYFFFYEVIVSCETECVVSLHCVLAGWAKGGRLLSLV